MGTLRGVLRGKLIWKKSRTSRWHSELFSVSSFLTTALNCIVLSIPMDRT